MDAQKKQKPTEHQVGAYLKDLNRDYHRFKHFKSSSFKDKIVPMGFEAEVKAAFKVIRVVKKQKNLIILDGLLVNILHHTTYAGLLTGVEASLKTETCKLLKAELLTPDCSNKTLINYLNELYPNSKFKMSKENRGKPGLPQEIVKLIPYNKSRGMKQTEVMACLNISLSAVKKHWSLEI